jgi:outer membrane immunogenic protein
MKRVSLALSLVLFAGTSAFAADIAKPVYKAPVVAAPVAFTWTGVYAGGFIGGAFGSEDPTDLNEYAFQTLTFIPRSGTFHNWAYPIQPGVIAGGTLGFNYQVGNFVFGLEGEAGYIHLTGSAADPASPGRDVVSSATLGDWYAIGAGRLGYAFDRLLVYGKGGAVFTKESANVVDGCVGNGSVATPCGPVTISATGGLDVVAPVVGGGIEYAFMDNWTVKAEYLFWALNSTFVVSGVASNGATYGWQHSFSEMHTAKIGLNYIFRP